jgi:hypothetical protein
MAWVAVIIACTGPLALDCEALVKPETFMTVEPCMDDVNAMLRYLYDNEVMATGKCVEVVVGDPV